MIASVTIAPRTSLAMCRGGLQGSPKADRSQVLGQPPELPALPASRSAS